MKEFYENRLKLLRDNAFTLDFSQIDETLVYDRAFVHKPHENICLIGEAPGENEVRQGVPFCGQAGKNLSELISISQIPREQFCITNGFCFRTFKDGAKGNINRTPSTQELRAGAYLLASELQLMRPKMIILLGLSALKAFAFLDDKIVVSSVKDAKRGLVVDCASELLSYKIKISHTFHPSPLVYNQSQKKEQLQDFFRNLKKCL